MGVGLGGLKNCRSMVFDGNTCLVVRCLYVHLCCTWQHDCVDWGMKPDQMCSGLAECMMLHSTRLTSLYACGVVGLTAMITRAQQRGGRHLQVGKSLKVHSQLLRVSQTLLNMLCHRIQTLAVFGESDAVWL